MNQSPAVIAVLLVRLPTAFSALGCTATRGYFLSALVSKTGVATNFMPSTTGTGSGGAGVPVGGAPVVGVAVGTGGGAPVAGVAVGTGGAVEPAAGWRLLTSSNRPCDPFQTPTRV